MDDRQVMVISFLVFTMVTKGQQVPALAQTWRNGAVPYEFESTELDNEANVQFLEATKIIEDATCVRFIPRTTERDYLFFTNLRYVTRAAVGRTGGKQDMTLYVSAPKWQMLALLMQTLGFYNEFRRTDRDNFVSINRNEASLIPETELGIVPGYNAVVAGSPFDVKSVLHSLPFFPSEKEYFVKAITVKNSQEEFGGWDTLSRNDVLKINKRYRCNTR